MNGASPVSWIGIAAIVVAVLQLRRAWGLPRRSVMQNGIGWALMLTGAVFALAGDGAWGLTVAALGGMATAALLITHAGWMSPRSKARAPDRRAHILPEGDEPRHILRRLLTFLLVVPLGFAASLLAALGARALAGMAGWNDADGNAMALLLLPVFWSFLIFWLLMRPRRREQFAWLAAPAITGLGLVWIGGAL